MTKNMRKKVSVIILAVALVATLIGKGVISKNVATIDPPGERVVAVIDPPGEGLVSPQVNPQVIDPPGE